MNTLEPGPVAASSVGSTVMTAADLRARRDAVVDAHIRAETIEHNPAATVASFRRARYDVPALGGVVDGEAGVHALIDGLLTAFPDFWARELARHHSEDAVTVEIVMGGTQHGEWVGLPPTGRPFEVNACCVFLFEDDGMVCERAYFDHATILRQLGQPS